MANPDFKLHKIGLIMLGVANVEKSVAFYRDKLGLVVQGQSPEFAFLNGDGVTLALTIVLPRKGPGATEVVFAVEHVRAAYEALKSQGVSFSNEPRLVTGPMFAVNFEDPDGHGLSLFGPE